jgi:deoxyadenosine/deoxycytidine kinase
MYEHTQIVQEDSLCSPYFLEMKKVYFLSGNIGVGKSSVLAHIRSRFLEENAVFVAEPVEEWRGVKVGESNLLQAMYEGTISMAVFQFTVVISRLRALRQALLSDADAVFVERSPFEEKWVFAKSNLSDADFQAYVYMFDGLMKLLDDVPEFEVSFLYLKADPEVLMDRIQTKRGRDEESGISMDYLHILDKAHETFFERFDWAEKISSIAAVSDFNAIDANRRIDIVFEEVVAIVKNDCVFSSSETKLASMRKYKCALTRVNSCEAAAIADAEALAKPISERARAARSAMSKSASKEASPLISGATLNGVDEPFLVLPKAIVNM